MSVTESKEENDIIEITVTEEDLNKALKEACGTWDIQCCIVNQAFARFLDKNIYTLPSPSYYRFDHYHIYGQERTLGKLIQAFDDRDIDTVKSMLPITFMFKKEYATP